MTNSAAIDRVNALNMRFSSSVILFLISIVSLLAFVWPLLLRVDTEAGSQQVESPFIFILLLPLLIVIMLAELSRGGWDSKALAMLAVLSGIGAILRPMGAGMAGIETVFFLLILGGRVFGPGFGFVLGNTTLFASALLTGGVGPWLPFQMIAAGWVGLGAGLLPAAKGKKEIFLLMAYGVVAGIGFGLLMNLWFWPFMLGAETQLSYVPGAPILENLHRLIVFTFATSLGWDAVRAVTNAVLIGILGAAVLATLRRAATKAAFEAPVEFAAPSVDELDYKGNSILRHRESRSKSGAGPQP